MAPFFSFASFGGGIASKLLGGASSFSATGGTQFEPGNGYQYIIFTSPGTLTVESAGSGLVDLLVVAGGGGGGGGASDPGPTKFAGGGGGAGGYNQRSNFSLPVGEYDISIGPGGSSGPGTELVAGSVRSGGPGTPSYISGPTITTLTAYGGGGGGGSFDSPPSYNAGVGENGGSGGGAAGPKVAGTGNKITNTSTNIPDYIDFPQGYPGGPMTTVTTAASGGGGASAAGVAYGPGFLGGDGRAAWSGDDGIPPSYGTPGPTPGRWFAGGGGGGRSPSSASPVPTSTTGGAGGGGNGRSGTGSGSSATANTGGGGGGAVDSSGGSGGSGIIIIRALV